MSSQVDLNSITNCDFSNLQDPTETGEPCALGNGGAISVTASYSGLFTISGSTFLSCRAWMGGGIYFSGPRVSIQNCAGDNCSACTHGSFLYTRTTSQTTISTLSAARGSCLNGSVLVDDPTPNPLPSVSLSGLNSTSNYAWHAGSGFWIRNHQHMTFGHARLFSNLGSCPVRFSGYSSDVDVETATCLIVANNTASGSSIQGGSIICLGDSYAFTTCAFLQNTYPIGGAFVGMAGRNSAVTFYGCIFDSTTIERTGSHNNLVISGSILVPMGVAPPATCSWPSATRSRTAPKSATRSSATSPQATGVETHIRTSEKFTEAWAVVTRPRILIREWLFTIFWDDW
jgi:hypothetical protein